MTDDAELEERGMGLEDVFGGASDADPSEESRASKAGDPSETSATSETSQSLETLQTQGSDQPETAGAVLDDQQKTEDATNPSLNTPGQSKIARENKNINMFLNPPTYKRLMSNYKQLDGEHYAQNETDLEKNRQYFDAVINTGLEHLDEIRDHIGLE